MLTAFMFDDRRGEPIDEWVDAVSGLGENQVLWVDLIDPSDEELDGVRGALDIDLHRRRRGDDVQPELALRDGSIRVTAVAVSDEEQDPDLEAAVIDCFIGENWVVTSHLDEIAVVREFRASAEGQGELGILDAPSFLASLLEWVVMSYSRAFAEIEATLEDFDVSVMASPTRDTERQISVLIDARSRIGKLRRALAPHREIFTTLSHPELDLISTTRSGESFEKLTARTDEALNVAAEAKDSVVNSFDLLILRTEHRTNEIMKVLTLASILLLPGALIAGVMGMNVNFAAGTFAGSPLFWSVIAAIIAIALATLVVARTKRWI